MPRALTKICGYSISLFSGFEGEFLIFDFWILLHRKYVCTVLYTVSTVVSSQKTPFSNLSRKTYKHEITQSEMNGQKYDAMT